MLEVQTEPDLQRLLQIFTAFMRQQGILVNSMRRHGTYCLNIHGNDRLGLHRTVLLSLCTLMSYCYQKKFVVDGNRIISTDACRRPVLEQDDLLLPLFRKWNKT